MVFKNRRSSSKLVFFTAIPVLLGAVFVSMFRDHASPSAETIVGRNKPAFSATRFKKDDTVSDNEPTGEATKNPKEFLLFLYRTCAVVEPTKRTMQTAFFESLARINALGRETNPTDEANLYLGYLFDIKKNASCSCECTDVERALIDRLLEISERMDPRDAIEFLVTLLRTENLLNPSQINLVDETLKKVVSVFKENKEGYTEDEREAVHSLLAGLFYETSKVLYLSLNDGIMFEKLSFNDVLYDNKLEDDTRAFGLLATQFEFSSDELNVIGNRIEDRTKRAIVFAQMILQNEDGFSTVFELLANGDSPHLLPFAIRNIAEELRLKFSSSLELRRFLESQFTSGPYLSQHIAAQFMCQLFNEYSVATRGVMLESVNSCSELFLITRTE